ncbi:MAG: diaminopimelate decarboxylase [Flexistipes sinusarabici]|uniref:Diaminopimelate decarboxylase n=1 Tax=Flexistipes sinusarabici TaxID=2352 RepID=A0A5D0MNG5_FLESI|nr:diaminopimelate decarboxylase [Flexistipes sinusarabici]TYB34546.1 MAG: diaminopimelate decarboxylase [Flexistipes sinusarabici]
MSEKKVPFNKEEIEEIAAKYPTPFHIYDEKAIRENARRLKKAFSWLGDDFKEYFAVKATPNPYILKIMKDEGFGTDCSSLPELILSEKTGITGENIMFTSNETPAKEYSKAKELGAIINLDDITHINYLEEQVGLPELLSFRYNPGPLREGNAIIGNPEEAKYGFTKEQLFEGYRMIKERGVKRFGIHTMVASNELNADYFVETVNMLVDLVIELYRDLGINFEFINMGGGIGIPYKPDQKPVDLEYVAGEVKKIFDKKIKGTGLDPLKLYMENGRMITGPYGYLVARAIHKKEIYKNYIGLDASMANLMRPGMYQAYHHVTVMGKENKPHDHTYDIVGSLCENNDKFAIDRKLPKIDIGDIIVIHDAGAHGHAMGFNYNGKLRSAELLLKPDGSVKQIRRAETIDDYFATLDFSDL